MENQFFTVSEDLINFSDEPIDNTVATNSNTQQADFSYMADLQDISVHSTEPRGSQQGCIETSGLTMRRREFDFPAKVPLSLDIRQYFDKHDDVDLPKGHWLNFPDLPTAEEINYTGSSISIPANKIRGAWPDKNNYLQSHYELLREDAISPLRAVVAEVKANPNLTENDMRETGGIYEAVSDPHLTS